ncbi:glucose-6-phosphate 1-dehydrogenase [Naumannella cuiyingiana]|uniref:Glucose-6-phosphate 1-dehydrogenase n=1 Tax=Naumannella cuiyingiana TaxID=1347891 RepID=A0A7Z0DAL1_9ACTN|nr:glucose-6-phosphate dehydrogenase [Naumannella cuiyingiana]NYI71987.1 glucose-6-phosphate 1-dehydrogenase [Naumannella cuiyingiana]
MASDATIFTLFGATGDLAKRMVLPAFWDLFTRGLMPKRWRLIGNGRGEVSDEEFRDHVRSVLEQFGPGDLPEGKWREFADNLRFSGGGFRPGDPGTLVEVIGTALDEVGADANYIHYLALPPGAFAKITEALAEYKLLGHDARVVYEKPFGTSLKTFRELDELVHSVMSESQVYRIDHFLGKEATQNLHVLRFANPMIGSIWDARSVCQVQIDVPETLGVSDRAEFYDANGAFRDMIATHLFQVAAEVAMEPPHSLSADDLQAARTDVLEHFRPLAPDEVIFGQFDGYRELPDVPDDSTTDTYAAAQLWVDSERWAGVPFVLRSGKRMHRGYQEVSLVLRPEPGPLSGVPDSILRMSLSGAGSMAARLMVKKPGPDLELATRPIEINLGDVPGTDPMPPYVSLLHDVIIGDRSLFTSSQSLERAWEVAEPVLADPPTPQPYAPGSWGPADAVELTDGIGWVAERAAG